MPIFNEDDEYCPNCGQHTGGESVCPNCGAVIKSEDNDLDGFHEEEDDEDALDDDDNGGLVH